MISWNLKLPTPDLFEALGMDNPIWLTIPFPITGIPSIATIHQRWSEARIKCDKHELDPRERVYYFFSGLAEGQYWYILSTTKPLRISQAAALSINDIEGLWLRAFTYMDIVTIYTYTIYMELIAISLNSAVPYQDT
jgi:hypothetical protein